MANGAISGIRRYDGKGNNATNPEWGKADEPLLRKTKVAYADGINKPASGRGNPRAISNAVCRAPSPPRPPHPGLSNFMWAWGQYVDHEIDLTPENEHEPFPFTTPANDPDAPGATVSFARATAIPGTSKANPRQQINVLSAYIDAANVYGPSCERATALRRLDGTGRLKSLSSKHGPLLPKNVAGLDNAHGPKRGADRPAKFFVAGDVRVNEHAVLTSMHTLFMREHNRKCRELRTSKSRALQRDIAALGRDEALFQHARRHVIALEQVITYEEFLPALLGPKALPKYRGYKTNVDASIANVFSTAAYRLGHSMLNDKLLLVSGKRKRRRPLREFFFKPEKVERIGIEPFLRGLVEQNIEQMDTFAVEEVRSFLFNVYVPGGRRGGVLLDLAGLNIQRGRDHGLPDYNQCRRDYGLAAKRRFEDITSDPEMLAGLKKAYRSVNSIDPWVGGLAEASHRGGIVGELFFTILKDQFLRLRDGDRFWYENDPAFSKRELARLKRTKLSDVIADNTRIGSLPRNVFVTQP